MGFVLITRCGFSLNEKIFNPRFRSVVPFLARDSFGILYLRSWNSDLYQVKILFELFKIQNFVTMTHVGHDVPARVQHMSLVSMPML